jgi:uncharacterized protein (DUF362 family)
MQKDQKLSRRGFLRGATAMGLGAISLPTVKVMNAVAETNPIQAIRPGLDLAVARNGSPAQNTEAVIDALGGMERFVKPGDVVVFKPNCVSAQAPPKWAVNTNPEVIGTIVRLCKRAGAKEVIAVTHDSKKYFRRSGIGDAIEREGGSWEATQHRSDFRKILLPLGVLLNQTEILKRVLDADVFINAPIAKHHGGTDLSLGMKNHMGINYDRLVMHRIGLNQTIADLASGVKTHLTVMDANYMLLSHGPVGPGETRHQKTMVAGVDPVLVDAYTTTLFKLEPRDIGYVRLASELGLGSMDLKNATIQEFNLQ